MAVTRFGVPSRILLAGRRRPPNSSGSPKWPRPICSTSGRTIRSLTATSGRHSARASCFCGSTGLSRRPMGWSGRNCRWQSRRAQSIATKPRVGSKNLCRSKLEQPSPISTASGCAIYRRPGLRAALCFLIRPWEPDHGHVPMLQSLLLARPNAHAFGYNLAIG